MIPPTDLLPGDVIINNIGMEEEILSIGKDNVGDKWIDCAIYHYLMSSGHAEPTTTHIVAVKYRERIAVA